MNRHRRLTSNPIVDERVQRITTHLRTSTRKRQSNLDWLYVLWNGYTWRTRLTVPASRSEETILSVIECLADPRDAVRLSAVRFLRRPDPFFEVAVGPLLNMLDDSFLDVRINTVRALINYGERRNPRIETLGSLLSDECLILRRLAARNIVETSPNDTSWSTLVDAAQNDANEFHTWIDGIAISILQGFGEIESFDWLRRHVVANPQIFDPNSHLCNRQLTDLWVDEIIKSLHSDDWDRLRLARERFEDRVRVLQSGNIYVNLIDAAQRRIQGTQ